MNLLGLWPALVLTVLPIPTGICAGLAVDAWLTLRTLRDERAAATSPRRDTPAVIILGLLLVLLDLFLLHTGILLWIGIVLVVVGLVLVLLGSTGHAVGNRRHYY
jgi:hypothetical protein